ncbi:MAG: SUMF1/EgtB/PvdO family nonheme iron enzyme [Alphaproteobacteria bacterium]|jgi:TPR repeat protein/formylglycine-generating enzyme required for sulfatase activity|nr:SUMF1/EgtB/PvdO family nonheme iron enzyme [Alphaproteobacteria bacterium]
MRCLLAAVLTIMLALPAAAQSVDKDAGTRSRGDDTSDAKWLRRPAEQGDPVAQTLLGTAHFNGIDVPVDHAEGVRWFRNAAELGNAEGQFMLGLAYDQGLGVEQDYAKALELFHKAAKQGYAQAAFALGSKHSRGLGVPRDFANATMWFRRAAELNYTEAQSLLAHAYAKGLGVPTDDAEAVKWLKRAAEKGHAMAQYNLGRMYEAGRGTKQDYEKAFKWLNLAAEQGEAIAVPSRDRVAKKMVTALKSPPAVEIEGIAVDAMDNVFVVAGGMIANVREKPGTSRSKIGALTPEAEVTVTGKVLDEPWYRVRLADGRQGFVLQSLLRPAAPWHGTSDGGRAGAANSRQSKLYPVGRVFQDCTKCPEMVVVPTGTFAKDGLLGGLTQDGLPYVWVSIDYRLAVGRYEVTRREFSAFAKATGHEPDGPCADFKDYGLFDDPTLDWRKPGFPQTPDHPVVCVSFEDAVAYVRWLSNKTGHAYRLLSDTEWEYAARAGTETNYWWGNRHSHDEANYGASANGIGLKQGRDQWYFTAPVGRFRANDFGLYDVSGNVAEWVSDCWNRKLRHTPSDGSPTTVGPCWIRPNRGGSWADTHALIMLGRRARGEVSFRTVDIGFRVARSIPYIEMSGRPGETK